MRATTMVTEIEEGMKTIGMEILVEVREEMHQLLEFALTNIFSTVNLTTSVVLKGLLVWRDSSIKWNRFQELTLLCPRMVPKEDDKIKRMASSLMDQKVHTYAARSAENKIKLDNHPRDNRAQPPPFKRQSVGGHNVARAYMVRSNKKRGYARSLPYCNKCKLHHEGQCTMKCNNCKKVGYMARDCKAAVATQALRAPVPHPQKYQSIMASEGV
ncbi:hypothetical protein Tco_0684334 [Tanacetum coccineum]